MKKTITYREITVAIGILVAVVIALTLWTTEPKETISGSGPGPGVTAPMSSAQNLLNTTLGRFTGL